jgi:glycosyltransferase involved in cell wall biosynthesis
MSVFNGENYLVWAMNSVLFQTFDNFEFVVLDDGSTDCSWQILTDYAKRDSRLRLHSNGNNLGLARSLNRGLELTVGEYVARMDADDISLPDRFSKQIRFLDANADIAILGTNLTRIDPEGLPLANQPRPYPTQPGFIRWSLFFRNCIQHPTVMFRRDAIKGIGGYDPSLLAAQDYDLWLRASPSMKMANLAEKLLSYRWHPKNVSHTKNLLQSSITDRIVQKALASFLEREVSLQYARLFRDPGTTSAPAELQRACCLMKDLLKKCLKDYALNDYEKACITKDFRHRLLNFMFANSKRPFLALRLFSHFLLSLITF